MAQQPPNKKCVTHVHHHHLPKELWESIFDCLWLDGEFVRIGAVADLIRVSAVCKNWQLVSARSRKQLGAGPFIMLPPPSRTNNQVYQLYEFTKKMAKKIRLPETRGRWICNSCNDWLVTIECTLDSNHQINLLNLFSRVQVQLPPPSTFQDPPPPISSTPIECFIVKAIVSSTPPLDHPNSCTVMAIHSNCEKLGFCKPGDTMWKTLKSENNNYRDILYFRGVFYAVGQRGNLVVCDIGCNEPRTVDVAPATLTWGGSQIYLVESSCGDLSQVVRRLDREGDAGPYYTRMFEVFKLDFSKHEWQEVSSLGGDSSLFVGHNKSMLVSTKDLTFRRDCIYFNDDNWEGYFNSEKGCYDNGVFDLKTKLVEPTFQFSRIWSCPLFWIKRKQQTS